jgi:Tol biopolymer transport system component
MKALLWKEWRENWLIVVLGVAVISLLTYLFLINRAFTPVVSDVRIVFFMIPLFMAVIGANLFSTEFGHNTISFLLISPISKSKLWFIKAVFGILMILLLILGAGLGVILISHLTPNPVSFDRIFVFHGEDLTLPTLFLVGCLIYTATLFISVLVSNTIAATFGSLIFTIVVVYLWGPATMFFYVPKHWFGSFWVPVGVLAFSSWLTFTRSELLLGKRRVIFGISCFAICSLILFSWLIASSSIDIVPIKSISQVKLKYLIPEKNLAIVQIIKSNEHDGETSYERPRYWTVSIPSGEYHQSPGRGYSSYLSPYFNAVSPDGNYIVCLSDHRFHGLLELRNIVPRICLFNTNTFNIKELPQFNETYFSSYSIPISWSPDSRKLLFYMNNSQISPQPGLYLLDIYSGENKFLHASDFPVYTDWLSNSKSVMVYYKQSSRGLYKWHYDQIGFDRKIISSQEYSNHLLSISPDAKWLLYSDATKQRMMQNVYLTNLIGSETTMSIRLWDIDRVAWSPDHKWLVIPAIMQQPINQDNQQPEHYSLQLINLETKQKIELLLEEEVDRILKWSADSKIIFYYILGQEPHSVIDKQINIDTREIQKWDDKLYNTQMFPDGRKVYSDKNKLYLVSADGKETKQLFPKE